MSHVIAVILLLAAVPATASQSSPAPANPYTKLFQLPKGLVDPRPAERKPKVVCGMTIIPADPKIDPKMVVQRPFDGVDYKIRTIDPPVCNPTRQR